MERYYLAVTIPHKGIIFKKYMEIHHNDVIIGEMASQITCLTIVYSTVYSVAD